MTPPANSPPLRGTHTDAEFDQVKAELAELRKVKDQFAEANFRQANMLNDIRGERHAFYNDLAEAIGFNPQAEVTPGIVESIKSLRARCERAERQAAEFRARLGEALSVLKSCGPEDADDVEVGCQLAVVIDRIEQALAGAGEGEKKS